ncbi:MAG: flagellar assembly protein FliW [Pirellulales bacterium]|nr:flagellar assembly protein FliW [Pirellulales bacterium]
MLLATSRFGQVEVEVDDLIWFPDGLLGLAECRQWVLLADAQNDALGWLQSTTRPEMALAVVSPRRFVPDYQLRLARSELAPLGLDDVRAAQVLVIVGKNEQGITLNLKAPLVINLSERQGRQVIHSGDQPLQYPLYGDTVKLRKTA